MYSLKMFHLLISDRNHLLINILTLKCPMSFYILLFKINNIGRHPLFSELKQIQNLGIDKFGSKAISFQKKKAVSC